MNSVVQALRQGVNIRDAVIFLIDWRSQMTENDPNLVLSKQPASSEGANEDDVEPLKPSMLSFCLRIVAEVMRTKIRARNKDAISVIAFGSAAPPTTQQRPGIRVIRKLQECTASGIKTFQNLAWRLESQHHMSGDRGFNNICTQGEDELQFGEYSEDKPFEFEKALWAIRHEFSEFESSKKNIAQRKKVFIFTTDDNPCKNSNAIRQLCMTHARDLADMNAVLDITILRPHADAEKDIPEHTMHVTDTMNDPLEGTMPKEKKFFEPLVNCNMDIPRLLDENEDDATAAGEHRDDDEHGAKPMGTVSVYVPRSYEEMSERVKRKEATKRAIRVTHLTLAPGYRIGVSLYALVRQARRPAKIELVAATNKELYKMTTRTCENVGSTLKTPDIRHMFTPSFVREEDKRIKDEEEGEAATRDHESDGKEEVQGGKNEKLSVLHGFTKQEMVKAKAIGKEGLVLYGFRPKSYLRREWCLGPSCFVFPDESKYIGSIKAFAALHESMLRRDVIAIVSVRRSETAGGNGMRFAALVPQEEQFSDSEDLGAERKMLQPGGMHLHNLPYKDDMYHMWRNELPRRDDTNEDDDSDDVNVKQETMSDDDLVYGLESKSVTAARRMIKKLAFDESKFDCRRIANPDLQRFYHKLELAAGINSVPNPEDEHLIPDIESMVTRAGKWMNKVQNLEAGDYFDAEKAVQRFGTKGGQKAAAAADKLVETQKRKEERRIEAMGQVDEDEYTERCEKGQLEKYKVAELKLICRAEGLRESGLKRDLVYNIEDHLRRKKRRVE